MTIKDIAKALGCSVSTVSRALQDNPAISRERREAIQQYAREHNYQVNAIASSLRTSGAHNTHLIGVVLPQLDHYYFANILMGIENYCSAHDYGVMIIHNGDRYDNEVKAFQLLRRHKVAGIICSQAKDTKRCDHFQASIDDGTPLVFVDRICTGIHTSRVVVDDYAGAFAATEHLILTGCRRIAYMGATMNLEISKNRYNGYRDAMHRHHLEIDPRWVYQCDNRQEAEGLTPLIMSLENAPDGFFTINDDTALGVLYSCKRMGLRVPEDVSICGFSNGIRAVSCDPQLTTVEQHGQQVGHDAAQLLIQKVEGQVPLDQYTSSLVKTRLVVRGTTREI